uniref:Small ribosomal subunit protein uS9c n=1 Tax=Boodleopsis pusilla TaxID=381415 RepID=A0A386AZL4_9CHLO|nr:ribosomal protein S9 [Boodleopsis pusilla]AYC64853.1 ribosomal protein S9 [Boodleopsis pusilla]
MKYFGLGRRKSAVAHIVFSGLTKVTAKDYESLFDENIFINTQKIQDYFQNGSHVLHHIQQVFKLFGLYEHRPLNMHITVYGGGLTAQKEAICLAIARALSKNGGFPLQKKPNILTQDSRKKERKKYGLKKSRKAPQYSKR